MHYRDTWARMLPPGFRWIAYTQGWAIVIPAIITLSPFTVMFAVGRKLWRMLHRPDREMAVVRPNAR
jgi:hypothetical protein